MEKISKTQIDKIGDHLRKKLRNEEDLRVLDDYRRSFGEAYEEVVRTIREKLNLQPTGRPAKSTSSIIEKLHRESIRLSQVQDIAGCRIIVADVREQDKVITQLREYFPSASVVDRRLHPSYGYRAVHVIIKILEKLVEVQIRTELQHGWAELSEKFSDEVDPGIKYGGGDKWILKTLYSFSKLVENYERIERDIPDISGKSEMVNLKREIAELINRHKKNFLKLEEPL